MGNRYYYTLLMASPVVDELTVDFAKELIRSEELGRYVYVLLLTAKSGTSCIIEGLSAGADPLM